MRQPQRDSCYHDQLSLGGADTLAHGIASSDVSIWLRAQMAG